MARRTDGEDGARVRERLPGFDLVSRRSDHLSRMLQVQDDIIANGQSGGPFYQRPYRGVSRTFCNYAVIQGLERMGVDTYGFRSGRVAGSDYRQIRQDAYGANRITSFLTQESANRDNVSWTRVPSGEVAQELANLGLSVVAAYRNPVPTRSGHVALVRPMLYRAQGDQGIPYLSNVGRRETTGIIPASRSLGQRFGYFASPTDPRWDAVVRRAITETAPTFEGPPHPTTSWLTTAVREGMQPSAAGAPMTGRARFLDNMGMFTTFRQETGPTFEGPPSPSTSFIKNLIGVGYLRRPTGYQGGLRQLWEQGNR